MHQRLRQAVERVEEGVAVGEEPPRPVRRVAGEHGPEERAAAQRVEPRPERRVAVGPGAQEAPGEPRVRGPGAPGQVLAVEAAEVASGQAVPLQRPRDAVLLHVL
jgi:hypothetical protein